MLETRNYNAMSLAQPTNFKGMLSSGEYLWGTGCRIAHPEAARILATTPYHFCFIDAVGSFPLCSNVRVRFLNVMNYRNIHPSMRPS
jgi:4-hydroxy-2-oxoheptanedioate aldolase